MGMTIREISLLMRSRYIEIHEADYRDLKTSWFCRMHTYMPVLATMQTIHCDTKEELQALLKIENRMAENKFIGDDKNTYVCDVEWLKNAKVKVAAIQEILDIYLVELKDKNNV